VARTIHQLSLRADQPLITVNCATIPEELIESELFGHEKGAFASANTKKRGQFELANNGTIFLDEIGDMSLKTQAKILRVLEEQKFQRVGGSRILSVNVRVITASNKDLKTEIEKGTFREDLYYRLNVIPIEVPKLWDRRKDIPLLIETFLEEFAKPDRCTKKKITPGALDLLCRYTWPGNVRELKNLVERLAIMVEKETIDESDIPSPYNPTAAGTKVSTDLSWFFIDDLKAAKKAFERDFIKRKLAEHQKNITKTAQAIGVGRSYLHKKLKNMKLDG
jgi:two-component system nitrogen regulation response regulator NtrX